MKPYFSPFPNAPVWDAQITKTLSTTDNCSTAYTLLINGSVSEFSKSWLITPF